MTSKHETVYMATMLAGLEKIVAAEIKSTINDAQIVEVNRGKVFFVSKQCHESFMHLRTADNVFVLVNKFTIGPHKIHLHELEQIMSKIDFSDVINESQLNNTMTFKINASRSGKHTYSRFELSEAASRGMLRQLPQWSLDSANKHQLEFRLDVIDEQAILCYRLTNATFRFRGKQRGFSHAALRPTVAHALVWESQPHKGDVFVDPFCGSGTIIAERTHYPFEKLLGGDISEEATNITMQNIAQDNNIIIRLWDAQDLPLDSGSVDKVVTNLPFGEQILDADDIFNLYLRFTKELQRIMRANGHAILMTDKVEEWLKVVNIFNLECYVQLELSLKGLHPKVFRVNF